VFDDIERRRILVKPARKDLAPGERLVGILALFDKDLDKGPGLLRTLPRSGTLTSAELDEDIAHALALAALEHNVLRQVVALVEQAQRGDAVLHRGAIFALGNARSIGHWRSQRLRNFGGSRLGSFVRLTLAPGERKCGEDAKAEAARHASGDHAS
jgi:hypothetical protein